MSKTNRQAARYVSNSTLLLLICLGSVLQGDALADDASANQTKAERTKRFREYAAKAAREYRFTSNDNTPFTLRPEPILNWTNPVGGDWDGIVFLWTAAGRPQAVVSMYKGYDAPGEPLGHEFHSLSPAPFTAERDDQNTWRPAQAGVEYFPVPDAPEPADSTKRRLVQMRLLARGFEVRKTDRDGTPRKLRLMPTPAHRYEGGDDWLDGALFIFAQTTDPEVLLLLEARKTDLGHRWHYGLARLSSLDFRVSYQEKEVRHIKRIRGRQVRDRRAAYTVFYQQ